MPKLFPISIDVEEVAVGSVLRTLNSMAGVVRLRLNLTQDKSASAGLRPDKPEKGLIAHNSEEDTAGGSGQDIAVNDTKWRTDGRLNSRGLPPERNPAYRAIAEVLMKTPAHLKVLRLAVERVGIHRPEAINGYMNRMQTLGFVKRTAPGTYKLSPKGEGVFFNKKMRLTPPDKSGSPPFIPSGHRGNHAGFRGLMLDVLSKGVNLTNQDIYPFLDEAGFSHKNLSTQGIKMREEGLIKFENGQYNVTEKGRRVYNSRPAVESSNQEEGVIANG